MITSLSWSGGEDVLKMIRRLFPIKSKKIRVRFLLAMILISVPSLFILGFISFNIAKDTLMENNTRTNQDHLITSSEVADLLFQKMIDLTRALVWDVQIKNNLIESNDASTYNELSSIRSDLTSRMQRIVNNNFIDAQYIDSVCIFNLKFEANCLGRSDSAGIYEHVPNKATSIQNTEWYQVTADAEGRVVFFSNNVLGDTESTFSIVKLFRDSADITGENLGIVIVNISKLTFNAIFPNNPNYSGEYLVVDPSKEKLNVIYPSYQQFFNEEQHGTMEDVYSTFRKSGYLVSSYKNEITGWHFIHLIKLNELLKESNKIGFYTGIITFAIALLALTLSIFISSSITRPLLQIKKMMNDWMIGSRSFDGTFENDEVGTIGETFKRMVSVNEELNKKLLLSELKEREAELRALQAQIKPHFLYNTLDSIYWMASLQKHKEVAQMAISLSESFKLSLNKGKETIPIYKELKHIEHYLTIQNIRYNNRFTYIEEVEPSIKGVEILKLILQPLIENAIYHGLEKKVGEGTVFLLGAWDGDYFQFVVEDDGVGIEDIAKTEQGFGLRNVRERLALYYGNSSSLHIISEVDKGTRVVVRFKPKV